MAGAAPLSAAGLDPSGTAHPAQAGAADGIKQQIHLAGRQRMLTQRMAKAMCLSLVGIDAKRHQRAAVAAADEFDRMLSSLRTRLPDLGLAQPQVTRLADQLDLVAQRAAGLGASVRQVVSGDAHSVPVRLVVQLNGPVLDEMNKAVNLYEAQGVAGGVAPEVAKTLNELGRLRMLSQRMAKKLCFVSIGLAEDGGREPLRSDMARFETTLNGVINGAPGRGLLRAPSREISGPLRGALFGWQTVRSTLGKVANGEDVTAVELLQVDLQIDKILVLVNEAVARWSAQPG